MPEPDTTPTWTHQRQPDILEVEGAPVAIRTDGDGATVLYLHGAAFIRQWLPFHSALARTCRVIAPEHPGFGDTPQRPLFRDFTDYVLHYDAVLRTLGLTDVHLVGHGLGGRLAAHLAVTYPERFASLTLIAPTGLRAEGEPLIDEFRMSPESRAAAQFNGREAAHEDVLVLKGFPADDVDAYADSTANALLTWTERTDRTLARRLSRVSIPTLVIAPGDDRFAGATAAARYADLIHGGALETPDGPDGEASSHALHIEQPDTIAELVTAHVRGDKEN